MEQTIYYMNNRNQNIVRIETESTRFFNYIYAISPQTGEKIGELEFIKTNNGRFISYITLMPGKEEYVGTGIGNCMLQYFEDTIKSNKQLNHIVSGHFKPFGLQRERALPFWLAHKYTIEKSGTADNDYYIEKDLDNTQDTPHATNSSENKNLLDTFFDVREL